MTETSYLTLTWKQMPCPIFGQRWDLLGFTGDNCGGAHFSRGLQRYVACATINGRYLQHNAGTLRAAMMRLEREIDKRSIGLLGIDDVRFAHDNT